VDQAILVEERRLVIIRFGHDWDDTSMQVCISHRSPN
jgi:DIM1 family U5 snRNP protein